MNTLPAPLLITLLVVAGVYGFAITRMKDLVQARRHATAAATLGVLIGGAIAAFDLRGGGGLWIDPIGLAGFDPLLGVNNASAILLPIISLMTLAWVVTLPRQQATPADLGTLILLQATLHGQLISTNLTLFAGFALLSALIPLEGEGDVALRRLRLRILVPASGLLVVAASLALAAGVADPLAADAHGTWVESTAGWVVFGLLTVSTVVRLGLFPMQWWMGAALTRGALPRMALTTFAMPAAWLLLRALGPHLSAEPQWGAIACWIGAGTALLGALMALTQRDLRRLVALLAMTQIGMVTTGLSSGVMAGSIGGLMLWLGAALSLTGLAIATLTLEVRMGTTQLSQLGGAGHNLPNLSLAFLVFGLMSTGLPGALDYIGDELVFEGAIHAGIGPTLLSVLALGLSAMAILRAWSRAFIGPRAASSFARVLDLRGRERVVLGALVITLLALGLAPHWLISSEEGAVDLPAAAAHPAAAQLLPHSAESSR